MPVRDEILEPVRRGPAWMLRSAEDEGGLPGSGRIVCPANGSAFTST